VLDYDAADRVLTRTVDPSTTSPAYTGLNLVTRYEYDALGRQTRTVDPGGVATVAEYDLNGQVTRQIVDAGAGKLNLTTTTTYDQRGKTLTVTDPGGTVTRYTYDKLGRRTEEVVDPNGLALRTSYGYDKNDNVLIKTVSNPAGDSVTRYAYDAANRLIYTVDPVGAVTKYDYDANGNVIRKTAYADPIPTSNSLKVAYTTGASNTAARSPVTVNAGETITMTVRFKSDAKTAVRIYTGAHSEWMTGNGDWQTLTLSRTIASTEQLPSYIDVKDLDGASHPNGGYALFDNLIITSNQRGIIFTDAFDNIAPWFQPSWGNGSLQHINLANPNDAVTNALRVDPAMDQITRNVYDAANRLIYTVDPAGAVTKYDYDANGNVAQKTAYANTIPATSQPGNVVADASRDVVTRNIYDAANRLIYTVDAVGAVTRYDYDANGNVLQKTAYATLPMENVDIVKRFAATIDQETFALRSTASFTVAIAGTYTFYTNSDDGSRLYINGNEIINNDALQAPVRKTGSITLGVGTHTLVQTYFEQGGAQLNRFGIEAGPLGTNATNNFGISFGQMNIEVFDYTGSYTSLNAGGTGSVGLNNSSVGSVLNLVGSLNAVVTDAGQLGRLVVLDPARDQVSKYTYDAANRQTRTTYPTVGIYSGESNAALLANGATGAASRIETSSSLYTQAYYDAAGNIVANRDAAGAMRYQAYDATGQMRYAVDAEGYVTGYVRDALGNVTALTRYADKIADATRTAWGGNAPSLATIAALLSNNSANRTISTEYDASGRAVQITEPSIHAHDGTNAFTASPVTKHTYNALGQIIQTQVRKDNTTWLNTYRYYDQRGLEIATIDALRNVTTQRYDAFGNVTERTEYANPLGTTVTIGTAGYTLPGARPASLLIRIIAGSAKHRSMWSTAQTQPAMASPCTQTRTTRACQNHLAQGSTMRAIWE
jgi:YD repeat-containing protein